MLKEKERKTSRGDMVDDMGVGRYVWVQSSVVKPLYYRIYHKGRRPKWDATGTGSSPLDERKGEKSQ